MGNGDWGLGARGSGIERQEPAASSQQPEAGSLHYALAHPCPGVGGERLYTLLRPTACQGGEGHAVARGGLPKARREPGAESRQPIADNGQRIIYPHTFSYSNSDTLRLRFPATIPYDTNTSEWPS